MNYDIIALRKFYQSELGFNTVKAIDKILKKHYSPAAKERVIGIGYPTPWLDHLSKKSERCMALMPATQGASIWPSSHKNATALVDECALPLADSCVDYVLMVHLLEHTHNESVTLEEIWRILVPSGRLIIIVPHRLSFWSNQEETPFGNGRPYSPNQLRKTLAEAHFTCHNLQEALYTIPSHSWIPETAMTKFRKLLPLSGGVLIAEGHKKAYQPVLTANASKKTRRRIKPYFVSQTN